MSCSRGCCESEREHIRSISFATSIEAKRVQRLEDGWDRDMPAYQRLRKNGLQPARIDGCAELESRATTQQEVEMGKLFTKEEMPSVREGIELAREIREQMSA